MSAAFLDEGTFQWGSQVLQNLEAQLLINWSGGLKDLIFF